MNIVDILFRRNRPIIMTICIAHIPERRLMLDALLDGLVDQCIDLYFEKVGVDTQFEITTPDEFNLSIGEKRNRLLERARGNYIAFIDDDDRVAPDYLYKLAKGILTKPDCCSLTGELTTDGANPQPFHHSIAYDKYTQQGGVFFRPPNHLNMIRADIAKQFRFPDQSYSEDTDWAMQLVRAGALKMEYKVPGTIYYYDYISNKPKPTR